MISPLAYIHPEAKIGENVEIAPFVFIDKNVVIGDNNKIMANANILYGSRMGNGKDVYKRQSSHSTKQALTRQLICASPTNPIWLSMKAWV